MHGTPLSGGIENIAFAGKRKKSSLPGTNIRNEDPARRQTAPGAPRVKLENEGFSDELVADDSESSGSERQLRSSIARVSHTPEFFAVTQRDSHHGLRALTNDAALVSPYHETCPGEWHAIQTHAKIPTEFRGSAPRKPSQIEQFPNDA
jgi:hypothetical protein